MSMTRSEFIEALQRVGRDQDAAIADLVATHAPFEPEPVEPKVGELLTKGMRMVDEMAAVSRTNTVWQYDAPPARWYAWGGEPHTTAQMIECDARIVFLPEVTS